MNNTNRSLLNLETMIYREKLIAI